MKNKVIEIRKETINDYPSVYAVNSAAFNRKDEARLTDRLRLSNAFVPELSLVATIEDKIIGAILFTEIYIVDTDKEVVSLSLAPIAVVPDQQNKGIGSQLIQYGLDKAKELGYKSVIVLGHKDYYPRFGFKPAKKWSIKAPFNIPDDAFMALELVEDSLNNVKGMVRYAKEFGDI
ncbi:MAG: N-acetyltransferase [Prevotella sp.]|jgi:predicted N-acetyltransferase YhbS|nr:N-acetyltransferase [Prevotella sp.]